MGRQMRSMYSPFKRSRFTCVSLWMSGFNPRALVYVGLLVVEVDWARFSPVTCIIRKTLTILEKEYLIQFSNIHPHIHFCTYTYTLIPVANKMFQANMC
jgi:hypothetical protein